MILQQIQTELKAPKNQYNAFGKYKYRSCEDIIEAVKPILTKYKAALLLSDKLVLIGNRYYVEATATLKTEGADDISVTAYAREEETKKGMDSSQITGSTSSYARKYALNGLFGIDDTKDPDSMDNREQAAKKPAAKPAKAEVVQSPLPQQYVERIIKTQSEKELRDECNQIRADLGEERPKYVKSLNAYFEEHLKMLKGDAK